MGAYDAIISRTDAAPLIPEEVAYDILSRLPEKSATLSTFRHKNMGRKQVRIPVKSALPTAYFRNGDTGLRQTTEVDWTNKYLNAEEIDCIVPIPKTVLDDVEMDIWTDIKPDIIEALGIALDSAIMFGVNKPSNWDVSLVAGATSAGNTVTLGTASQATGGIAKDVSDLMGTVESDGYDVNSFLAPRSLRSKLRGARDTTGQKLLDISPGNIEDTPVTYGAAGQWPTGSGVATLLAGDATQGIIGIRQDLEWTVLDQAVIQDGSGAITYNLPQQGMVALMVTARFAWATPNPINRQQPTEASRYPFGVLLSA